MLYENWIIIMETSLELSFKINDRFRITKGSFSFNCYTINP